MDRLWYVVYNTWIYFLGMRPLAYKNSFRRVSKYIHQKTNMTAMLWSPNVGVAYPFGERFGKHAPTMHQEPDEFLELDTNRNGRIDDGDGTFV
jgi:hypothetical protein